MASNRTILEKAAQFEDLLNKRHIVHGQVLPVLVESPHDLIEARRGNYENAAFLTGLYAAAESFRYAATRNHAALASATQSIEALLELETVTKVPGLMARAIKAGNKPLWDENFFWRKPSDKTRLGNEWHQTDNGRRWLGDPSKSQIFGAMFGMFVYTYFFEVKQEMKDRIPGFVERVVQRIESKNFTIVDADGLPTGHGDYKKPRSVGPLLMLGMLKLAHTLTKKRQWEKLYQNFYEAHHRDAFITSGRVNLPLYRRLCSVSGYGSEDNLTMLNLYMLLGLESEQSRWKTYHRLLEKSFQKTYSKQNALFSFVYHAFSPDDIDRLEESAAALEQFPTKKTVSGITLKRKLTKAGAAKSLLLPKLDIEDWPTDEYAWRVNPYRRDTWVSDRPGTMHFTGVDYLLATYLGMKHGFVK